MTNARRERVRETHGFTSCTLEHSADDGWRIVDPHLCLRERVTFLCVCREKVRNWAGEFLESSLFLKGNQFVISPADLVWNATLPCLDLVKVPLCFVIATLTHVDGSLALIQALGTSARVSGEEHDVTFPENFVNVVVAVLAGLDDFVLVELLFNPMHRLLRAVVPAGVDPDLTIRVFPGPEDLCYCRLIWVIGINNVNPVAYVQR